MMLQLIMWQTNAEKNQKQNVRKKIKMEEEKKKNELMIFFT